MDVTLSWAELRMAAEVGMARRLRALAKGRAEPYGTPSTGLWEIDIQASAAEMAVAKALGMYWSDTGGPGYEGDVGRYEVRWTARPDGCLILHDDGRGGSAFILVVGTAPVFRIPGWIRGRDGQDGEFWQERTGRPCWMVPQDVLHPIDGLIRG